MGERYVVTRRLALTEDGRVVDEGHLDARWLYAVPGMSVPMSEAEAYGLVDKSAGGVDAIPGPTAAVGEPEADPEAEAKPARRTKRARE